MSQENLEIVRKLNEAFEARDIDAFVTAHHPSAEACHRYLRLSAVPVKTPRRRPRRDRPPAASRPPVAALPGHALRPDGRGVAGLPSRLGLGVNLAGARRER